MPASSSMTARAAGHGLSPSLAIVVCSAPMARSRARRSRAMTAAARLAMLKLEARPEPDEKKAARWRPFQFLERF
jgi:hypothetical protein